MNRMIWRTSVMMRMMVLIIEKVKVTVGGWESSGNTVCSIIAVSAPLSSMAAGASHGGGQRYLVYRSSEPSWSFGEREVGTPGALKEPTFI